MDTISETRRRLLEREVVIGLSCAGLLGAQAVAQLDNNLSEFLDLQGKVPDRARLSGKSLRGE